MATGSTALIFSEYSAGHDTGSHPENQSRLTAIQQHLKQSGLLDRHPVHYAEPVDPNLVSRVHDEALIDITRELAGRGGGYIDGDTLVAPGSYQAALASAGGAVQAVDLVMSGEAPRAFSMCRPPGHHVERKRQMGFCLFNSMAIGAMQALDRHGAERIAIIDWDVHHGNGTQDVFYESPDVLFCSVHQWPLFPGTGLESERGSGPGEGLTLNVPLPPGTGDEDYLTAFDEHIQPRVFEFAPDLLMVSAGFDAHADDPLAMMSVTAKGFGHLAGRVRAWADALTGGKLVLVLEGGYNLRALSESVAEVLDALDSHVATERDTE